MRMSKPRFAPTRPSSARPGSNKPNFHGSFRDEHLIDQAVSDPLKSRKKEHELSDHRSTQFHPAHRRGNPWRRLVQSAREPAIPRSEEHTSELQSLRHLVCRLLLEKKKKK